MYGSFEPETNIRSTNRIIKLEILDGKLPLSSIGMVDRRLFAGENNLRGILDEHSMLWYMEYDKGKTPEALRQRFTSFKLLLEFARDYFRSRNIRIKETID